METEGLLNMKIGWILLLWFAISVSCVGAEPVIGIVAAPGPTQVGGAQLSLRLVGDVAALPAGSIIEVQIGSVVVAQTAVIDAPVTGRGIDLGVVRSTTEGVTVIIKSIKGPVMTLTVRPLISGTVEQEGSLWMLGYKSFAGAIILFIDSRRMTPLVAGGLILAPKLTTGWHDVTVCQNGSCDTAFIRIIHGML